MRKNGEICLINIHHFHHRTWPFGRHFSSKTQYAGKAYSGDFIFGTGQIGLDVIIKHANIAIIKKQLGCDMKKLSFLLIAFVLVFMISGCASVGIDNALLQAGEGTVDPLLPHLKISSTLERDMNLINSNTNSLRFQ